MGSGARTASSKLLRRWDVGCRTEDFGGELYIDLGSGYWTRMKVLGNPSCLCVLV